MTIVFPTCIPLRSSSSILLSSSCSCKRRFSNFNSSSKSMSPKSSSIQYNYATNKSKILHNIWKLCHAQISNIQAPFSELLHIDNGLQKCTRIQLHSLHTFLKWRCMLSTATSQIIHKKSINIWGKTTSSRQNHFQFQAKSFQ